jgi:hypothetical protein
MNMRFSGSPHTPLSYRRSQVFAGMESDARRERNEGASPELEDDNRRLLLGTHGESSTPPPVERLCLITASIAGVIS